MTTAALSPTRRSQRSLPTPAPRPRRTPIWRLDLGGRDHGRSDRSLALASIKTAADASAVPPHFLPRALSFENYAKVIGFQAGLATYVGNSALVAAMTIAACLTLAAPAGYGLARFAIRGREVAFLVLLAPIMIPDQAILTPLYLDFAKIGLVNSHLGLSIGQTILQLPFSIFLMRANFEAVPREIEEAAVIDGCSTWQRLIRVSSRWRFPAW